MHCCPGCADILGRCASHPDAAAFAAEEGRCHLRSYWHRSCWLPHESRMSVVLVLEFRHMRHRIMLYHLRRCYKGRSYQTVREWPCPPKVSRARTSSPYKESLVYVTTISNVVCWTDRPTERSGGSNVRPQLSPKIRTQCCNERWARHV